MSPRRVLRPRPEPAPRVLRRRPPHFTPRPPVTTEATPGEVLDAASGPFERRYAVRPARRS
jgi:hypothetical protein